MAPLPRITMKIHNRSLILNTNNNNNSSVVVISSITPVQHQVVLMASFPIIKREI